MGLPRRHDDPDGVLELLEVDDPHRVGATRVFELTMRSLQAWRACERSRDRDADLAEELRRSLGLDFASYLPVPARRSCWGFPPRQEDGPRCILKTRDQALALRKALQALDRAMPTRRRR